MDRICLLDLNYTLVSNQATTKTSGLSPPGSINYSTYSHVCKASCAAAGLRYDRKAPGLSKPMRPYHDLRGEPTWQSTHIPLYPTLPLGLPFWVNTS